MIRNRAFCEIEKALFFYIIRIRKEGEYGRL